MDNLTANKSCIPCQSWEGQNGWSTASTQRPLLYKPPDSQHLSLGSSSDQIPFYDHPQMSSQSCVRSLSSGINTHHSNLFKTSHINSNPLSTSLFTNTALSSTSNTTSYDQQNCHMPSLLLSANQGNTMQPPPRHQQGQGLEPQHLPFLSDHDPFKESFHHSVTNEGLPEQDLHSGLPACEQPQWTPSSYCKGAVDKCVPDVIAHPKNRQEDNNPPGTSTESRRSTLLRQREELLKQLEEMDKLLDSEPTDESRDEQSPHTADQSQSMDASSECEQTKTSDALQDQSADESQSVFSDDSSSSAFYDKQEQDASDVAENQLSSGESEERENASAESGDDLDSDFGHVSDDDATDFTSDSDGHSSDEASDSDSSTSGNKRRRLSDRKIIKSKGSLEEDKSSSLSATNEKTAFEDVVLPVLNSKDVRTKKNYCLFCSRSLTKMARHLERMHSDRAEVAVAFQYPKKSRERFKIWSKLINEGNFAHNREVLKMGKGQLMVRKRSKQPKKVTDFVHCPHCRGLYWKKFLFKHLSSCKEKSENDVRIGRKPLALKCVLETSEDIGISDGFKGILCGMWYDDVTHAIMKDKIILQVGEQMFTQCGDDVKKQSYIKENLRHLGRLVLEAAKTTPLKNLEEFFCLSSFPHVVSAVNILAGYDPEKKTYSIPSLALKLGHHLQKACIIVEENALKCGDDALAKSAQKFLCVYQKKWTKLISSHALKSLKETKRISEKLVPLVQDVKALSFYLERNHVLAEEKLRQTYSIENFSALAKVILARVVLFNRRKGQEVSSIQISQFVSRKKSDVLDDMDISVTDLERTMCGFFSRIDIRGTSGRMVPVLLKPSFESTLELLVDARDKCGVLGENPYLFGRPTALTAYRGAESIQNFIKDSGAKNSEALILRQIKKHHGTMLQMINLDENEAYQILGPNNQVQALRQNIDLQLDDVEMISGGSTRPKHWEQAYGDTTDDMDRSTSKGDFQNQDKHKWSKAEVRAVERHMMRLIEGHKLPQKDDCLQCIEAEPDALKRRTWRGVKNYVRNRITALKRQSGSPQVTPPNRRKTQQEKRIHETTKAPPKSSKSKTKGFQNKGTHKWGEAEVRAVERHMMRFIKGHKVPQKDDCDECIEAEPDALRRRTWKDVKNFVRNRITTLKRQSGSHQVTPTNRYKQVKQIHETTKAHMTAPPKSAQSKDKGPQNKNKHKWSEAEVRAVERHMMRFIKGHKVPQKDDCEECIEAEPDALKARTWKGVKDYVRNRITTLKRQSGYF